MKYMLQNVVSRFALTAAFVLAVAMPNLCLSAVPEKSVNRKKQPTTATVELFAGMESGAVSAVMIMKDSTEGTVLVTNKTDKPLTLKLPEAFAGVPILAQRGMGGMGGMGGGMGGGRGGMQGMGGGMMGGGMGGGMGGMGGGGGMFSIGPEKVQKIKIAAVCLDHGKIDPNPKVIYQPIPIESYSKDPAIAQLVKLMRHGQIDQHSAQAAAWHIQNGLTWEELAKKIGIKHINGTQEPYFTADQIDRAFAAARIAKGLAEQAAREKSQSETSSPVPIR